MGAERRYAVRGEADTPTHHRPRRAARRRSRRGATLIYMTVALIAFLGFCSLSVDVARVQLVKSELQLAVDAAARQGASSLPQGDVLVRQKAADAVALNRADGRSVVLDPAADVAPGYWDAAAGTFTAGAVGPTGRHNAVRVMAYRTKAKGTAVSLAFGQVFGQPTCDVAASSIAMLSAAGPTVRVEGISNPWLAGMPAGPYGGASNTGTAPLNSPGQVTGLALTAGAQLSFAVTGSCADDPVNINYGWNPDGQPGGNRTNDTGYLNGMSNLNSQQGSLVGVFLDNNPPTSGGAPPALDFTTGASRNYSTLSPRLHQPFFIGDGRDNAGNPQRVVVPAGATRLFLGLHDNVNWNNNSGYFLVTVGGTARPKIVTVR